MLSCGPSALAARTGSRNRRAAGVHSGTVRPPTGRTVAPAKAGRGRAFPSEPVLPVRDPSIMDTSSHDGTVKPAALALLSAERPRNVNWFQAGALLFGDWGTSRLYVLGLAFLVAGRSSFWLILGMSGLILAVAWAYTQICRIYPDGGGVYTAARQRSRLLGVIGALLLFADYTITASLSAVEAFHYFGLGEAREALVAEADPGSDIRLHSEKEAEESVDKQSPSRWHWKN